MTHRVFTAGLILYFSQAVYQWQRSGREKEVTVWEEAWILLSGSCVCCVLMKCCHQFWRTRDQRASAYLRFSSVKMHKRLVCNVPKHLSFHFCKTDLYAVKTQDFVMADLKMKSLSSFSHRHVIPNMYQLSFFCESQIKNCFCPYHKN